MPEDARLRNENLRRVIVERTTTANSFDSGSGDWQSLRAI